MSKGKRIFWVVVIVLVAVMAYWIYGNFKAMTGKYAAMAKMMGGPQGAMPVQAARCQRQDVTQYHDFTGTTEAVDSIEVRARVQGYLQDIHFIDGSFVEKGQLLFTIEPEPYVARRNEAASRVNAAQAEQERARLDFERIQEAAKINAVSKQDLSRSQAAFQTAQAMLTEAASALERAELELSYTQIHSPISGKVGRHLVDAGNLVGADMGERTLLTTVVQVEPMYVFFYANEQLLEKAFLKGVLLADSTDTLIPFSASLAADADYRYEGHIRYVDNTVDPLTGTIYVRGQLPNHERTLLPGMFMRVRVAGEAYQDAIVVEERALISDLNGKYLLVIGANNVLERRNVTLGLAVGTLRQITEGLTGDEAYVVSSLHIARPGMTVVPDFGKGPEAGAAGKPTEPESKVSDSKTSKNQ